MMQKRYVLTPLVPLSDSPFFPPYESAKVVLVPEENQASRDYRTKEYRQRQAETADSNGQDNSQSNGPN